MFNKKIAFLLIFIILNITATPILASDSIYVWSNNSNNEVITTSALIR